jgi:hypothetical protein
MLLFGQALERERQRKEDEERCFFLLAAVVLQRTHY